MIRRGPCLAGLFALALWSAAAFGQNAPDARASFEQGVRLLEDARYAEAAAALERSLALRESPSVLYNLALAYRGTGAYLRAIATFERFLNAAPEREPLRRDAATIAAELRGALARVRLSVRGLADEVRLDDRVLTPRELDVLLPVDPGRHVFEARRAGYESATRTLTLSPGASDDVLLDVTAHPLPARLQVQVSVDDAVISVDGVERGRGTFSGELPPGAHTLEVRASSHQTERRALDLAPGRQERVVVTLSSNPSVLSRWWFWTGAAVVVAGLVVGGVLLFSGTEAPVQGTWGTAYGAALSW